ncbi:MAG TPA: chalcone isomerase family protein, partial [Orrella sp.]
LSPHPGQHRNQHTSGCNSTHKAAQQRLIAVMVSLVLAAGASIYTATSSASNNASTAAANGTVQPAWASFLPKAGEVGSGEFRWWGFLVYEATLYSPRGEYQPGDAFALSLRYARDVSRDDIVEASIDQMRDLGLPVSRHPEWKAKLDQVMASVKSGDTLTGVYTPDQGAVFFHNDKLTGQVSESLAKAFFAIWLDPKTSEPKLRQALLGQTQ